MRIILSTTLLSVLVAGLASAQDEADVRLKQSKAREYFINGTSLQLQGNRHAEAILEFQESLTYDSTSTTLTAMARSYLELGKLDRAEKNVRAALAMDDTSRDAWEVLAEILIASGKYDEGVEAYEHVRELKPTKRQLYTLGRLYEPRSADKAIAVFEELVRTEPDVGVFRRLANLYDRKRDMAGVIRSLERARDLDVENASVTSDLIQAYIQNGQVTAALETARRFQSLASGSTGAQQVWASLLEGIFEDTLVANLHVAETQLIVDESIRNFPNEAYLLFMAGGIGLRIGDLPRANIAFDNAARSAQNNADVLLQIGVLYMREGFTEEAARRLADWQVLHPHDARFLVIIGDAMWSLERHQDAAIYYRSAVELDPRLPDTWAQLGMVYDVLNEVDSSDAAYRQSLALDPMNATANNNYAYSLAVRGLEIDKARELSWNAVQQSPDNSAYLDTYAWVLFKAGDLDRAETYIEKAVRQGGNATHYDHWGDILEAQGRYDEAVKAWREALDRDPERQEIRTKIDRYR